MKTGLLAGTALGGAGAGPTGFAGQDMGGYEAEEETPNVEAAEQQQYDAFVQNGMRLLYTENGEINDQIAGRLGTGAKDNPIQALAQTATWLVMAVESSAKKSGQEISDDVMLHAGKELFEQLVEISEALGFHEYKQAELQGAWYQALDMYREANSDEGDRFGGEGGQEAVAAFEELNEADKEGRANEVLPGFYETTERALALAKQDENPIQEEGEAEQVRLNDRMAGRG